MPLGTAPDFVVGEKYKFSYCPPVLTQEPEVCTLFISRIGCVHPDDFTGESRHLLRQKYWRILDSVFQKMQLAMDPSYKEFGVCRSKDLNDGSNFLMTAEGSGILTSDYWF